jgi:hypothetical protein
MAQPPRYGRSTRSYAESKTMPSSACMLALPVLEWRKSVGIEFLGLPRPTLVDSMDSAYRERRSRRQIEGPLAPYFGAYSEHLADLGYSLNSHKKKTFIVGDFSRWLGWKGIALDQIRPEDEAAFIRGSARRHSSKRRCERFVLDHLMAPLCQGCCPRPFEFHNLSGGRIGMTRWHTHRNARRLS